MTPGKATAIPGPRLHHTEHRYHKDILKNSGDLGNVPEDGTAVHPKIRLDNSHIGVSKPENYVKTGRTPSTVKRGEEATREGWGVEM